MQMHSSYVVTDPKGTLVLECGKMLYENGYDIKILNDELQIILRHLNQTKFVHK